MLESIINRPPGVLLLAGLGSRLSPVTDVVNKNLLPVYDKPMALHSLDFLQKSGIRKIIVVANPKDAESFSRLFELNKQPETSLFYVVQDKPLGTAHAIKLVKQFITEDEFFSLWGDNVFEFNLGFSVSTPLSGMCRIHLTRVGNPQDFGVVEIDRRKRILRIADKPKNPRSNIVCTGFMGFKSEVFGLVKNIAPNPKGEYDIMGVVRLTHSQNMLEYAFIRGSWIDAGVSFDTLLKASILAKEKGLNR